MPALSCAPTYIVVDLRDVMTDYSRQIQMYNVYTRFPLSDLVATILSSAPYNDHGEFIWNEMDRRFQDTLDQFNFDILAFYFEMLTQYLDETIRRKIPEDIDTCAYVFHRWIDSNTVILQHDNNALAVGRSVTPHYVQFQDIGLEQPF